jgi:glyoxylase-like metal-dependent hydrolase (beta-lactamase superfamily II)
MSKITLAVGLFALCAGLAAAQSRASKTLDMYVVDVEGGNATLFVTPSGESVLIDTGNGGAAATRDADRIMAAVKDAGVTRLDHLITTHWHGDHFGAMADSPLRRPWSQRPVAAGVGRVPPEGLSGPLRQGHAHRRETR